MPQDDSSSPKFRADKYRWLKARVKLDLLSVDEELSELPVIIQEACECTAMANEIRESTKDEFEITCAQIADDLRSKPDEKGKFPSETAVGSQIPLSPLYKEGAASLSEARLDASLWASVTEALRTKSSALRVSADLITAGYLTTNYLMEKRRDEIRRVAPLKA